ncbi:MAG: ABC transporter permease subunit [Solidesulfovibrio sp.]|uniref:PstA family ABC transporter permease n=1 Tax=Solidesulfovibrio sp. TaxID=2910990 RepID=UPI002B20B08F|nr:ABC transporter permease subunit [Solidesulfovibrio sp.]MEA4855411.1 ABC transporter permease subunit [Solidesulfovibrio sp.]
MTFPKFAYPAFRWFCRACALCLAAALAGLFGFLLWRGLGTLGPSLFFGEADPWRALLLRVPVMDGLWPACLGTLSLLGLTCLLAVPVGIAAGVCLAEYAAGPAKAWLTFCVELLASIPSVVMGLFGFTLILFLRRTILPTANTCLLLAAGCLALLVLPYLVSATQKSLESLPESLRLIGPSLGLGTGRAIRHILLPASARSILAGVILAVGRAAEDTAVILLTGVVANAGAPAGLAGKFEALPFTIYSLAAQYQTPEELDRGYGAAMVLLALTGSLFVGAHLLHATLRRRWQVNP